VRRELILVFAAIAAMIVLAFVVPLGLSARSTARDRAMDEARAEAAKLVPLVATADRDGVVAETGRINATGRLAATAVLPDGSLVGAPVAPGGRLQTALEQTTSLTGPAEGGREVVTAVALAGNRRAAVRVFVSEAELSRGVAAAWVVLGALGLALILLAVALADRIAQRVTRPAARLAEAAEVLGDGRFDVRVEPDGPPELAATAGAFNTLAGQVSRMVEEEREMVSELTHRLRTPLTRLRVGLDQLEDEELAAKLQQDVTALTREVNDVIARARRKANPPKGVDLAEVAGSRFEFWSALADDEDRAATFRAECSLLVPVEADELEAALDVLIENVFSHTPPGTPFELSIEPGVDGCVLAVDDGGPGFDPTLAEVGRSGAGSTGLGLSIVERLATTCGGGVRVGRGRLGGARVECRLGAPPPPPRP
jgi:signal transduction histidine kinase